MDLKERELSGCLPADTNGEPTALPANRLRDFPAPSSTSRLDHKPSQTPQQENCPMDLHHPILREFPEHRDAIRRLKGSDDHFRNLFDEYHRLDDSIYRIEEEIDFATDQEIEELKMRRAKLKDYIYHLVRHVPPVCPVCDGTGLAR
jgi:uncharacterized protein YdcH (DUF465 family)